MTYEVTATRRRPQRFDDLVGQEFTAATLKNAIQSQKIAPAYLFSGPRGCGKTSSARILAKALNCEKGPAAEPCGVCPACVDITQGSNLDVIEIDGASNTGINDVRQIKDELLFPPNACRYKIYIIDEVHMLSNSAFNALLKTIEEPPPYAIFIFATTELHKVPATIKSRCQQFNFRLVSVEQLKDLLADAAKETGIQADEEALFWIAREATGSVRDAYTLFDQVTAFSENHITYDKIRDKLGLVGFDRLNTIYEACVDSQNTQALSELDTMISAGVSIEQFTTDSADYMRSLLLIQQGITKESLLGQSASRFSQKVLSSWNVSRLEQALSIFLQLFRDIRYSVDPRFDLELAIVKLCSLTHFVTQDDLQKAILQVRAVLLQGASPASSSNSLTTPSFQEKAVEEKQTIFEEKTDIPVTENIQTVRKPTSIDELKEFTVEKISQTSLTLGQALLQTKNWRREEEILYASVASAFLQNQLSKEIEVINDVLSTVAQEKVLFRVEIESQHKEVPQQNIPEVDILCKVFKGTEVTGSK